MENIRVINYSEKSFAILGEGTKVIKDNLKSLGGKFNRNLTDPETGEKIAGWIFSIKRYDSVITALGL